MYHASFVGLLEPPGRAASASNEFSGVRSPKTRQAGGEAPCRAVATGAARLGRSGLAIGQRESAAHGRFRTAWKSPRAGARSTLGATPADAPLGSHGTAATPRDARR